MEGVKESTVQCPYRGDHKVQTAKIGCRRRLRGEDIGETRELITVAVCDVRIVDSRSDRVCRAGDIPLEL